MALHGRARRRTGAGTSCCRPGRAPARRPARRRRGPAGRRARPAGPSSSSAVSAERGGGRVERRPGLERRVHDARAPSAASSAPTGLTSTWASGHHAADPLGGRREQLVEGGVDLAVPLEDDHVAGVLALEQRRARDPLVQLAAVPDRGEPVGGAADDRGRHPAQHARRRGTCRAPGSSGRTRRPPRTASPRASGRRSRRTPPAPRRRTRTGRWPPWRPRGRPGGRRRRAGGRGPGCGRCGWSARRPAWPAASAAGSGSGRGRRRWSRSARRRRPGRRTARGAARPARRSSCRPSSGRPGPPGPSGTTASRTVQQVAAELVDGGVALGRAAGAAVRALVVVDRADQAAVGRALEVPAVEVERVAVAEDDGQRADRLPQPGRARRPRRAAARRRRRPP